jgi:hypothetical protein
MQTRLPLGPVKLSGPGPLPSSVSLRFSLAQQAARQFDVPIDEIEISGIETDGTASAGWTPDFRTDGTQGPPQVAEVASWSARTLASRKVSSRN